MSPRLGDLRARAQRDPVGLLMVKTLHKCILGSLVSNLQTTLTERSCTSVRRPNQATPPIHVYQGVGMGNYVDNLCCELCCSFIIKTPALSLGPNFKLIEDGEFLLDIYRCCQRCPRLDKGMQTTH